MRYFGYILCCLLMLAGFGFSILNAEPVTLNYYLASSQIPLSLLLVAVLGLGIIVGLMPSVLFFFRVKVENKRLKTRNQLLEKEIANIRAIPLQDDR